MLSLIQLSDTHLSRNQPFFHFNFEVALREINKVEPDLVVITGDLALNGPDEPDDLVYAREQFERVKAPWISVRGNHDLGLSPPEPKLLQKITQERLDRVLSVFVNSSSWTM